MALFFIRRLRLAERLCKPHQIFCVALCVVERCVVVCCVPVNVAAFFAPLTARFMLGELIAASTARQSRDCLRVVRLPSRLSRESSVRFSREKTPRMALSTTLTASVSGTLRSLPLRVVSLPAIASVIRCVWLRRLVARHSPRRPWLLASLASRGANRRTARRRVAKFAHRPSPSWFARAA